MAKNELTYSEENYLKAIYNLAKAEAAKISVTLLAEALNINPASVVDMVGKLVEQKLIRYDKKKGAELTEKGNTIAMSIVRKHRLWEVFLLDKLGFGWDEVHQIAEQLEHIDAPDLAGKLDEFLGFPEYDPHGDPIPKANGETAIAFKTTLSEVANGKTCRIAAVKDATTAFLQYLTKLGLRIGSTITVVERNSYDDSVVITIEKGKVTTVSKSFTDNLLVRE